MMVCSKLCSESSGSSIGKFYRGDPPGGRIASTRLTKCYGIIQWDYYRSAWLVHREGPSTSTDEVGAHQTAAAGSAGGQRGGVGNRADQLEP
jgi:hypothetical protein